MARAAWRARAAVKAGAALLVALCAALSSCARVADFAAISKGNRLHERGRYQEAALAYLGVRRPAFEATVDYDLANVYARLGEHAAAAELYERARRSGDRGVSADSHFNEGVSLYEKGRYEESWRSFKEALSLCLADPALGEGGFSEAARWNLELAWRAWKKRSQVPPATLAPAGRSQGADELEELKLLRRLETGRWKPGRAAPPDDERGDY